MFDLLQYERAAEAPAVSEYPLTERERAAEAPAVIEEVGSHGLA